MKTDPKKSSELFYRFANKTGFEEWALKVRKYFKIDTSIGFDSMMYWSEKKLNKFNGVIYGFILDNYGGNNISPNDYDLLEDMAGIYIFTGNVIDYEMMLVFLNSVLILFLIHIIFFQEKSPPL